MCIQEMLKEPIPSIFTILQHIKKFESMIQFGKDNSIKKISYSEVKPDSRLGTAIIAILRQQYDIDYVGSSIFYIGDEVIPYLLNENFYDSDIVDQITDDHPMILQMYKDISFKCPKWWLDTSSNRFDE
jgi:hypothetical protein